jgi:hypothetical protein
MAKGGSKKTPEVDILSASAFPEDTRITIPFDLEEVGKLKIGQEITVTIKGCVNRLEGDEYYSSIGLKIYEKSFRRTSNAQAEEYRNLIEDPEED